MCNKLMTLCGLLCVLALTSCASPRPALQAVAVACPLPPPPPAWAMVPPPAKGFQATLLEILPASPVEPTK